MKLSQKILTGLAITAAAGVVTGVAIILSKKCINKRMLTKIADEGYETAHDILYPNKDINASKLRYGPVIPGY